MSKKEKWEPPETALVYARSMQQENENRLKIPLTDSDIKVFDNLSDDLFKSMVSSDKKADTLKLKKQVDVLAKIRFYLRPISS